MGVDLAGVAAGLVVLVPGDDELEVDFSDDFSAAVPAFLLSAVMISAVKSALSLE